MTASGQYQPLSITSGGWLVLGVHRPLSIAISEILNLSVRFR